MTLEIEQIRRMLVEKLSQYEGKEPIHLDYDGEFLQKILFDVYTDIETRKNYYGFSTYLKNNNIYQKIDFSNIPLNNVCLAEEDLSKLKGIKVDPQIIWDKSLIMTKCNGVEFVGSFDDVKIVGTDFRGSIGAVIDPQKVWNQDFLMTQYNPSDIKFVGSFENCANMKYNSGRTR